MRKPDKDGYIHVRAPGHPRADSAGYVYEHVLVAEEKYGRPIVLPEEVHHKDFDKTNNSPGNLFLCKNRAEHKLIHKRTRAFLACGDPLAELCHCGKYQDPAAPHTHPSPQYLRQQRAIAAIGDPDGRMCYICKQFDVIENLHEAGAKYKYAHRGCEKLRQRKKYDMKYPIEERRAMRREKELAEVLSNAHSSQLPGDYYKKCRFCKKYDTKENLYIPVKQEQQPYHTACANADQRRRAIWRN